MSGIGIHMSTGILYILMIKWGGGQHTDGLTDGQKDGMTDGQYANLTSGQYLCQTMMINLGDFRGYFMYYSSWIIIN